MTVLIAIACLAVGALVCYFAVTRQSSTKVQEARRQVDDAKAEAEKQLGDARTQAEKITADAQSAAESAKREALIEAKEKIMQMRQASLNEEEQRKNEIHTLENRLVQREESLDKRNDSLDRREHQLQSYQGQLDRRKSDLDKMEEKTTTELERIAGLSSDEAHDELIGKIRQQSVREEAQILRESEQRVRAKADKTAREIVSTAIQRCAADQAGEITVTSVHIPSDDLKGRIIGREGRNIRTFEQVTGVSLVIDDTPETVVLSSFDPVRRETARVTLENLIADGRIHPARVREAGEQAAFDMGIHDLHPELIKTLGALRYRTSYGQNVLSHSVQVATLCGIMASELGMDEAPAKRAGLLHDIGKAIDHEVEGPHAVIGADLARRYGEKPEIVHAIEAHHADVEPDTVLDVLVQAADAISAARPGARRESAENYIKRLEKLEEIANAHEGVERTYAMQAGRELHVMVEPEKISDAQATVLAHDIAKQIEDEMEYPGQVRVVVIRESRAVDTAK